MNVVFMSANLYRKPFQVFTYPADIIVKILFDRIINQVYSVFCTENDMRVYFGERLWHRNRFCLDYALQGFHLWRMHLA